MYWQCFSLSLGLGLCWSADTAGTNINMDRNRNKHMYSFLYGGLVCAKPCDKSEGVCLGFRSRTFTVCMEKWPRMRGLWVWKCRQQRKEGITWARNAWLRGCRKPRTGILSKPKAKIGHCYPQLYNEHVLNPHDMSAYGWLRDNDRKLIPGAVCLVFRRSSQITKDKWLTQSSGFQKKLYIIPSSYTSFLSSHAEGTHAICHRWLFRYPNGPKMWSRVMNSDTPNVIELGSKSGIWRQCLNQRCVGTNRV